MCRGEARCNTECSAWYLLSALSVRLREKVSERVEAWSVVRVMELAPIAVVDGSPLIFRIEVLRHSPRRFMAKIWRIESHRVRPSFLPHGTKLSDVELLFREDHMSPQGVFASASSAMKGAVQTIETQLRVKIRAAT